MLRQTCKMEGVLPWAEWIKLRVLFRKDCKGSREVDDNNGGYCSDPHHNRDSLFRSTASIELASPDVFTFHRKSSAPRNSLLILSVFPYECPKRMVFALVALISNRTDC